MFTELKEKVAQLINSANDKLFASFKEQLISKEEIPTEEKVEFLEKSSMKAKKYKNMELAYNFLKLASEITPQNTSLMKEAAEILENDLWKTKEALIIYENIFELEPNNEDIQNKIKNIKEKFEHWEELYNKYISESESESGEISSHMYGKAAEIIAKYNGDFKKAEELILKALEKNKKGNFDLFVHLRQIYVSQKEYINLIDLIENYLDYIEDSNEKYFFTIEVAKLYLEQMDSPEQAENFILKAQKIQQFDDAAKSVLVDVYTQQDKWTDLIGFYEKEYKLNADSGILMQLAMLYWKKIGDLKSAEVYFQKLMKSNISSPLLLNFYEDYSKKEGEYLKYISILQKAMKEVKGDSQRTLDIARKITEATKDKNPEKAIDVWKKILRNYPQNEEARQMLKVLYEQTGKWNALIELYKDEEKHLDQNDIVNRVNILLKIAKIIEEQIGVDAMAVNIYSSILELDPSNSDAMDSLIIKYENMGRWKNIITIYENKVQSSSDNDEKTKYLKKIADIWLNKLSNPNKAAEPLEQILEISSYDSEIISKLEEIYNKRRNWQGLYNIKSKTIEMLPEDEQLPHIIELAQFAQKPLGNMNLAIETWNKVLERDPLDIDAIDNLTFLYERKKRYPAVVEMLSRKISMSTDDEMLPLLEKAASFLTDKMQSDGAKAVDMWQKVLEFKPNHPKAIKILKNLYAKNSKWDLLEQLFAQSNNWLGYVDTLMDSADHSESIDRKIELYFKVAEAFIEKLNKPVRAIKPYEKILVLSPRNAKAALALLPLYEQNKKWEQVYKMYEILLNKEENDLNKKEYLIKLIDVSENKLKNKTGAFEWCGKLYELFPEDTEIISHLEELAEISDNWKELSLIYEKLIEKTENSVELILRLAKIYVNKLADPDNSEKYWRKILEVDSSNFEAMDGLIDIYTAKEDWDKLVEILKTKLELDLDENTFISTKEKLAFSIENYFNNQDEAIKIYKEILEFNSNYIPAMEALVGLYEQKKEYEALIDILHKQKEITEEPNKIKELNLKLGNLYLNIKDFNKALNHFTEAFQYDSEDTDIVFKIKYVLDYTDDMSIKVQSAKLLSPYYQNKEDWENYVVTLEIIAKNEENNEAELAYYQELLDIEMRKVGDTGKAFEIAKIIFAIEPANEENRKELRSLSKLEDTVEELKQLYKNTIEKNPSLKVILALEIANMEQESNNLEMAKQYYNLVLQDEPAHDEAYLALENIYSIEENWEELRTLYKLRVDALSDLTKKQDMFLKLSKLNEDMLSDYEAAIESYKELRTIDSSSEISFQSLINLYEVTDKWEELADLYLEELDSITNIDSRINLMYKRLYLLVHKLNNYVDALIVIKSILDLDKKHAATRSILLELLEKQETKEEAADILIELYEREEDYENLVKILEIKLEFITSTEDEVELLNKEGFLYSSYLGASDKAFDAWKRAIIKDPYNENIRLSLEKLAKIENSYENLITVWKDIINVLDEDDSIILLYLQKIAEIYEEELINPQEAVIWYKKLLNKAESDRELQSKAALSLMNLLSSMDEWIEVIELKRRELGWIEQSKERKDIFHQIAKLQEDMLEALDEAAETYKQLLDEFPDDPEALDKLEIIYTQLERWAELVSVLEKRVDITYDPEQQRNFLSRIAMLKEESLNDPEGAAEAWASILQNNPDDLEAIRFLARLYEQLERWTDVFDLVEKELQLSNDPDVQKSLTYRLGYILQVHMDEPERAIDRFRAVLEEDPTYEKAKIALETMLKGDEILALQAAEILEDIYKLEDNWEKLTDLYGLKAEYSSDPNETISLFIKIAEIKETELNNSIVAFRFYGMALKEAVTSPELENIINQLQRLASLEGKWEELISLYKSVCDDVMDIALQEQMLLTIADISRDELEDLETSKEYYRKVLENSPDNLHAIDALERVYEQSEAWESLLDIYVKRIELSSDASDERYEALIKAANLCKEKLDKKEQAIEYYKDIIVFRPDDTQIFRFLEELYFDAETWEDLIELYENRISYVENIDEAVELRFNMGEIFTDYLDEPERGLESFRAALGGEPSKEETINRLEKFLDSEDEMFAASASEVLVPIYAAKQDWNNLIKVFSIQRKMIEDPTEKSILTHKIAELYETALDDLNQALTWYGYLLIEKPEDSQVLERLLNLADLLEKWDETANVFAGILEEAYGDDLHILRISEKLAEIYSTKLSEIDKAKSCYLRILNADRNRQDIFDALETMLIKSEKWEDLLSVYRDAADFNFEPEKKNPYLYKISDLLENKLDQIEDAIDVYKEILDGNSNDENAMNSLERLYKKSEKWEELVELLLMRTQKTIDGEKIISIQLELASLYNEKLEDSASSVDRIEEVLKVDPVNEGSIAYLEKIISNEDVRLRVARLLQPIYETLDNWEKLIEVYEIQIELIMDEINKIEYLKKCANLYETRGNNETNAFVSISKAWLLDPTDTQLLDTMYNLSIRLNNWEKFISVLEEGVEDVYDVSLQVDILLKIARIWSETLENYEKSVSTYERVLQVQDDNLTALKELAILLEIMEKWEELADILEKTVEYLTDTTEQINVLRKLAKLHLDVLNDDDEAIETWKKLKELNEQDIETLDSLEILYEKTENWNELTEILKLQMDVQSDKRMEKAFRLVDIQETKLEDNYEAINTLTAIVNEEPDNIQIFRKLKELYRNEEDWESLIGILDKLITLEANDDTRNELIFETALILQNELSDIDEAVNKYRFILEFNPNFEKAIKELETLLEEEDSRIVASDILIPIYKETNNLNALINTYKLLLEVEDNSNKRQENLRFIAELYEKTNKFDNAFKYWGMLLKENPSDQNVEAQIFRLAESQSKWKDATVLFDEISEDLYDDTLKKNYLMKEAQIYELSLDNLDKSIEIMQKASENISGDMEILSQLDRLLLQKKNYKDLAEILELEAESVEDSSEKARFLHRLGNLRYKEFNDPEGSIEAWREVLNFVGDHTETIQSLEMLLAEKDEYISEVLDVLEPIYDALQSEEKLIDAYTYRIKIIEDPSEKAAYFEKAAQISAKLGKIDQSLELWSNALKVYPEEMRYAEAFIEVSEVSQQPDLLITTVLSIIKDDEVDDSVAENLALKIAVFALKFGKTKEAEEMYKEILKREEEHIEALTSLEELYRIAGNTKSLVEILKKRSQVEYDTNKQKTILTEIATLSEVELKDIECAISAWKSVLELDESEQKAQIELMRLYEQTEKWEDLIEIIKVRLNYNMGTEEAIQLRHKIAEIYSTKLGMNEEAEETWRDAYDMNPQDETAYNALIKIYSEKEDWDSVKDLYFTKLGQASIDSEKIPVLLEMAELAFKRLNDVDEATGYLRQVLDIDPSNEDVFEKLEQSLIQDEKYYELIDIMKKQSEYFEKLGQKEKVVEILAKIARIWEEKLETPEEAIQILQKLLEEEPGNITALTGMARLYENQGNIEKCQQMLETAALLEPKGKEGAELAFRRGTVALKLQDTETAMSRFNEALKLNPEHQEAFEMLTKMFREKGDKQALVSIYELRLPQISAPGKRLPLLLEVSDLFVELGATEAAFPHLEEALNIEPDNLEVKRKLGDAYFAAGNTNKAESIYSTIIENLGNDRKHKKDLAVLKQRMGQIFEAKNNIDKALEYYNDAKKLDPSNIAIQITLANLHINKKDFEQAERLYKSLLFQRLGDAISKSDIYHKLAVIEYEKGDNKKALSFVKRGLLESPEHTDLKTLLQKLS